MRDSVFFWHFPLGFLTSDHSSTLLSASLSPLGLDCAELLVLPLGSDMSLIFLFFFFVSLHLDGGNPKTSAFKSNHLLMMSQRKCNPAQFCHHSMLPYRVLRVTQNNIKYIAYVWIENIAITTCNVIVAVWDESFNRSDHERGFGFTSLICIGGSTDTKRKRYNDSTSGLSETEICHTVSSIIRLIIWCFFQIINRQVGLQ